MTTWAQPVRHPWFDPPTMKRKQRTNEDEDASFSSDVSPAARRRKRVRYTSLERTLAHMTLATPSQDVDMWPRISPSRPCGQESLQVILPSSVEEPDTYAPEPADMEVEPTCKSCCILLGPSFFRRSSEYIVVTSCTQMPPPLGQLDIKEVQISSAVLECLRRQSKYPPAPIPLPPQASQALVLYRTPRPPTGETSRASTLVAHEDDVMEVE